MGFLRVACVLAILLWTVVNAQDVVVRCETTTAGDIADITGLTIVFNDTVSFNAHSRILASAFNVSVWGGVFRFPVENASISGSNLTLQFLNILGESNNKIPQTGLLPNVTFVLPLYNYVLLVGTISVRSFTCEGRMYDRVPPIQLWPRANLRCVDTGSPSGDQTGELQLWFSEPVQACDTPGTFPSSAITIPPTIPSFSHTLSTQGYHDTYMNVWSFTYTTSIRPNQFTVTISTAICDLSGNPVAQPSSILAGGSSILFYCSGSGPWYPSYGTPIFFSSPGVLHDTNRDGVLDTVVTGTYGISYRNASSIFLSEIPDGWTLNNQTCLLPQESYGEWGNVFVCSISPPSGVATTGFSTNSPGTGISYLETFGALHFIAGDNVFSSAPSPRGDYSDPLYIPTVRLFSHAQPLLVNGTGTIVNRTHGYALLYLSETIVTTTPSVLVQSLYGTSVISSSLVSSRVLRVDLSGFSYLSLRGSGDTPDLFSLHYDVTSTSFYAVNAYLNQISVTSAYDAGSPAVGTGIVRDTDLDGYIDQIDLSFTVLMENTSFYNSTLFTIVDGSDLYSVKSVTFDTDVQTTAVLSLTEILTRFDTSVTPSVSVEPPLKDLYNNPLSTIASLSDGASPILLSATLGTSGTTIDLTFSEVITVDTFSVLSVGEATGTLSACVLHTSTVIRCDWSGTLVTGQSYVIISNTTTIRDLAHNVVKMRGGGTVYVVAETSSSSSSSSETLSSLGIGLVAGLGAVCLVLAGFLMKPYFGNAAGQGFRPLRETTKGM